MLELILVRHGQTEWNKERRIMGSEPIGLNQTGINQVQLLEKALSGISIDHIFSSPLQRTVETTQILNQNRGLSPIFDPDMREIEYGEWAGKTFKEVHSLSDYSPYAHFPEKPVCTGGESLLTVQKRAIKAINRICMDVKEGRVMIVSHADWIKTVVLYYLQASLTQLPRLRIDNASVSYLTHEEGEARLITMNLVSGFSSVFVRREPL